jgi:hypothetical protein
MSLAASSGPARRWWGCRSSRRPRDGSGRPRPAPRRPCRLAQADLRLAGDVSVHLHHQDGVVERSVLSDGTCRPVRGQNWGSSVHSDRCGSQRGRADEPPLASAAGWSRSGRTGSGQGVARELHRGWDHGSAPVWTIQPDREGHAVEVTGHPTAGSGVADSGVVGSGRRRGATDLAVDEVRGTRPGRMTTIRAGSSWRRPRTRGERGAEDRGSAGATSSAGREHLLTVRRRPATGRVRHAFAAARREPRRQLGVDVDRDPSSCRG